MLERKPLELFRLSRVVCSGYTQKYNIVSDLLVTLVRHIVLLLRVSLEQEKALREGLRRGVKEGYAPPRPARQTLLNKTRSWGGVRCLDHPDG